MTTTGARLTVGQLADAAGMTPKALRHYDRVGLFAPDGVDDVTGYRWYAADRLPEARLIARLRAAGLPLDAVRTCLAAGGDPAVVRQVLDDHRRRLESRLTRVRGDLHRLAHLAADPDGTGPDGTDDRTTDLPVPVPVVPAPRVDGDERRLAAELFNGVWALMETENRTAAQDDSMLHMAHASRYHWEQVGTAANLARGEWLCSRVYAVLGRPEPALHHARRVLAICEDNAIADWDLAFAHEALARAHVVAGAGAEAGEHVRRALDVEIADDEDRALLLGDLRDLRNRMASDRDDLDEILTATVGR